MCELFVQQPFPNADQMILVNVSEKPISGEKLFWFINF